MHLRLSIIIITIWALFHQFKGLLKEFYVWTLNKKVRTREDSSYSNEWNGHLVITKMNVKRNYTRTQKLSLNPSFTSHTPTYKIIMIFATPSKPTKLISLLPDQTHLPHSPPKNLTKSIVPYRKSTSRSPNSWLPSTKGREKKERKKEMKSVEGDWRMGKCS